jgi:hypothetical protein
MKLSDKQAFKKWEQQRRNIARSTDIVKELPTDQAKRIKRLESNPEEWFQYYFPNYFSSPSAQFHRDASSRIIDNDRWYESRAWARGLAKSTRSMMEFTYLALTGKIKNLLLISNSNDNAIRLLMPFMINFEENQRIKNDYGIQVTMGSWEAGDFKIKAGCTFRAVGALESPRGSRNENYRADAILIDDFDTDKECRNPDIITHKWKWIEEALIPTLDVSGSYRVLFNGNVIAKDCCVTRFMKIADYIDLINIRGEDGKSSWIEKNSEEDIDKFLGKLSYAAGQKEYFNNPISEGKIFKKMVWGQVPDLSKIRASIVYGDPAPSNKEVTKGSYKSVFLIAEDQGKFYVYTGYLDHTSNPNFVDWYFNLHDYINEKTHAYYGVENNSLQDPFYEQVFQPLFLAKGKEKGYYLPIRPDGRKKPEKFTRIEGNLEPLHRNGQLILNIAEKDNPHMQRLEQQFMNLDEQLSSPADGPDCIEGGIFMLSNKLRTIDTGAIQSISRTLFKNKQRY